MEETTGLQEEGAAPSASVQLHTGIRQTRLRYDYSQIKKVLNAPIDSFAKGAQVNSGEGKLSNPYFFIDNGAKVLAVAHLDTVVSAKHFGRMDTEQGPIIISPRLDDRLGAWVILHLLPSYGLKYDILLTTGEETGNSSAKRFSTTKKYNWGFEFDRRGTDYVLYGYESYAEKDCPWIATLNAYGFTKGIGSYSDIASLEKLGCKMVNIGTGYHDEHTFLSYAKMLELEEQVDKFVVFFRDNEDKHYPHEKKYKYTTYEGGKWKQTTYGERSCKNCGIFLIGGEIDECKFCKDASESERTARRKYRAYEPKSTKKTPHVSNTRKLTCSFCLHVLKETEGNPCFACMAKSNEPGELDKLPYIKITQYGAYKYYITSDGLMWNDDLQQVCKNCTYPLLERELRVGICDDCNLAMYHQY